MKRVFVDTSFYVALVGPRDELHERATDLLKGFSGKMITTDFVLVELGNFLSKMRERGVFTAMLERLRCDEQVAILEASRELIDLGVGLFKARPDKSWSVTDCISFVVMEREKITEALTADRHFEQAGFSALLTS